VPLDLSVHGWLDLFPVRCSGFSCSDLILFSAPAADPFSSLSSCLVFLALIFGFILIAERACWFVWHRFVFLLNLVSICHQPSVRVPATEAQCSGQVQRQILVSPARARQLPATCLFVSRCCSCSVKDLILRVSCWLFFSPSLCCSLWS
jgi:hypothetical protein